VLKLIIIFLREKQFLREQTFVSAKKRKSLITLLLISFLKIERERVNIAHPEDDNWDQIKNNII
jgi:hypothetical protein